MNPAVSVVIPTYKRQAWLAEAVASVLAQSYRDFELIVVDDGSSDGTPQMFESKHSQIRYFRQGNRGVFIAPSQIQKRS